MACDEEDDKGMYFKPHHIDMLHSFYSDEIAEVTSVWIHTDDDNEGVWCVHIGTKMKFGGHKLQISQFMFDSRPSAHFFGKTDDIRDLAVLEVAKRLPQLSQELFMASPVAGYA